jgi:hypothetical protein
MKVKRGTQWLKPGLVGRARHLKGEQQLRHATLHEIREDCGGPPCGRTSLHTAANH